MTITHWPVHKLQYGLCKQYLETVYTNAFSLDSDLLTSTKSSLIDDPWQWPAAYSTHHWLMTCDLTVAYGLQHLIMSESNSQFEHQDRWVTKSAAACMASRTAWSCCSSLNDLLGISSIWWPPWTTSCTLKSTVMPEWYVGELFPVHEVEDHHWACF